MFVLQEEGFYLDACTNAIRNSDTDVIVTVDNFDPATAAPNSKNASGYVIHTLAANDTSDAEAMDNTMNEENKNLENLKQGCKEQEAKLNLWFSVAVSFMYLTFTGIGYLTKKLGTRLTRCMFM